MGINEVCNNDAQLEQTSNNVDVVDNNDTAALGNENVPSKSPLAAKKRFKAAKCRKWDFARNIKKGAGVRQTRRSENLNSLLNLVEKDECEEVELLDVLEPKFSTFAELFLEQEKMQVWNDFINHTEEDQEMILQQIHNNQFDCYGLDVTQPCEVDSNSSWEDLTAEATMNENDKRKSHPAYSVQKCFQKIDHGLRTFLKKQHIPYGELEHLEVELISFFTDFPSSVMISTLGSSFERLMMHALCQYLDLSSHSFNDPKGKRQTEIENNRHYFIPPAMKLTEFLESKYRQ